MRIEDYFEQSQNLIRKSSIVRLSEVFVEKRSSHQGSIRGMLTFMDDSVLHFREFVDVETSPDRVMYVYQYQRKDGHLVFRYDNAGHHRKLGLSTYPHHQHVGDEQHVLCAEAPDLVRVLDEIQFSIEVE